MVAGTGEMERSWVVRSHGGVIRLGPGNDVCIWEILSHKNLRRERHQDRSRICSKKRVGTYIGGPEQFSGPRQRVESLVIISVVFSLLFDIEDNLKLSQVLPTCLVSSVDKLDTLS